MSTQTLIELTDNTLTAAFDPSTGALVRLRHHALEWDLVSASDGGLSFALSVPRPGRRVAKVDGLVQTAPRVEVGNRCVTFRWSGVTDDEGCRLPISVETRARIADGFLLFDATVVNKSDRVTTGSGSRQGQIV